MRYQSTNVNSAKILWATLLACYLQACLTFVVADNADSRGQDDNLQVDGDEVNKRDWNKELHMWGKRGWSSIHGGWALKNNIPSLMNQQAYPPIPIVEKRSWNNLQGGWGKRSAYEEDDAIEDISSMLEPSTRYKIPTDSDDDFIVHDKVKRNWSKFTDGWGKRSKWDNFKGTWGKRQPAWSNLKGIWGKRSEPEQFLN
ncbi:myoinhibiting peptide precursor [Leptinotarsa decemlineata]|uniref:myoinhibiting peptide precursor n=1 Tax=Leptinotarsa decemlineata TaxID=7539 RepID=UPI003D30A6E1